MAYNIGKVNEALAEMNGERKQSKKGPPYQQWKPSLTEDGKPKSYSIRFLPYKGTNEQPFEEVMFYDDKKLNRFRLVAPAQYGLEDPIAELVTELRKNRNNDWKIIKPLLAKPRFFAPVFVREEAEKGVQVWELSPTLCKEIYGILVDDDYRNEDVTSPEKGFDFSVKVTSSGKTFVDPITKKVYPVNDVTVKAKRDSSKLHSKQEEAQKLIASTPKLTEIFMGQCLSAEELKEKLENYLAPAEENSASANGSSFAKDGFSDELPTNDSDLKSVEDQFAGL